MNNISCNVIEDILPLYVDEIVSEDTCNLVAEHLDECAKCRQKYESMKKEVALPAESDIASLKQFKTAFAKKKRSAFRKGFIIAAIISGILLSGYLFVRNLPVDWDSGACAGGYAAFIFDKYSDELSEKYYNASGEKENITSVKAIRGTHSAEWKGQAILLQFDIEYEHITEGKKTETVRFLGQRTWIDTYDWSKPLK